MELNPQKIAKREKLILIGLYLSRYDFFGIRRLGFSSFQEAFNAFGYALGARPASIKNYRDEFDPLFPNRRKGWHKRSPRDYCTRILEEYRGLDVESFTALIEAFVGYDENELSRTRSAGRSKRSSSFAQRLVTGLAAERYFESICPTVPEFSGYSVTNTTMLGCGYDFRLEAGHDDSFLAVEVKGLNGNKGTLSLTPMEHEVASTLADRFFLFIVKNFKEAPSHEMFRNPLLSPLQFVRKERVLVQVSWFTNI